MNLLIDSLFCLKSRKNKRKKRKRTKQDQLYYLKNLTRSQLEIKTFLILPFSLTKKT